MHDGALHPGSGGLLIVLALSVAACAGIEPAKDEVYVDASRHLAEARADPDVSRHARVPLNAAARTLAQAQEAEDLAQLRHLSYLGRKQVDIARAVAETRGAEARLEILTRQARAAAAKARRATAVPPPQIQPMAPPPQAEGRGGTATPAGPDDDSARAAVAAAAAAAERDTAQVRRLEQTLPDFKVQVDKRNTVITLPETSFPPGTTTLDPKVSDRLSPLVEVLKENLDRKVVVNGHTDDSGDPQQNIRISNARAESVKARLVDMGIAETRILTIGYGHNSPIASNDTAAGRRANRRVEIVLMRSDPRSETIPPGSVGMGPAYPHRPSPGIGTSP
jgi:outer membrane protein OmpA-like peptidoglycan-associated protein